MTAQTLLFSPKIGGDTEGVENLTIYAPPTFCRPVNLGRTKKTLIPLFLLKDKVENLYSRLTSRTDSLSIISREYGLPRASWNQSAGLNGFSNLECPKISVGSC